MSLTVEDGSGIANADAYVAAADVQQYAQDNNLTWLPDTEQQGDAAVRVATRYIDGAYRCRFSGQRLKQLDQGLEWPRSNAVAYNSYGVRDNVVPPQVRAAVCEAAVRELANPGSLSPDVAAGSTITSVKADTVSIDFGAGGYTPNQSFATIDMILYPVLVPYDAFSGRVGRG